MKVALVFFCVLTSLSLFATQGTTQKTPPTCRGKVLPIALLAGPKLSGPGLPLRFAGMRQHSPPPFHTFPSQKPLRLVIKSREEFADYWKQLTAGVSPDSVPPTPHVDFAKDIVVVSAMGQRPSSGYWTFFDGACEVDGQVEVFVTSIDGGGCGSLGIMTYPADAVRLPRTDLPVVFRETQVDCRQLQKPQSSRP